MIRVAMVMRKMLGGGVESVIMNYYRHIDRSQVQFDFLVDEDSTLVPRDEISMHWVYKSSRPRLSDAFSDNNRLLCNFSYEKSGRLCIAV